MSKNLVGKYARLFVALPVLGSALALLSCSSNDRQLHLLDGHPAAPSLDAEAERLRKLMLVQVIDTSTTPPTTTQIDVSALEDTLQKSCDEECTDFGCQMQLCKVRRSLCIAKSYLAAAQPQATALQIGTFLIPPQSAETNSALASSAMTQAQAAISGAENTMNFLLGISPNGFPPTCENSGDNSGFLQTFNGQAFPAALTTYLMEGVQVFKEATDIAVDATISSSDAQFGSTSSMTTAVARAIAGTQLSRSAAAHLLTNGSVGLLGSPTAGFCSSPALTPEGTAALSIFRQSAISPVAILATDDSLSTTDLLDDLGATVQDGSVAQRLAELNQTVPPVPVETFYNLPLAAFNEARQVMREEITTFSRSLTAVLPAKLLPGGQTTTFKRFAATAGPPGPLPASYYAAIARFGWDPFDLQTRYDTVIDSAFTYAGLMLSNASQIADQGVRAQTLGPAALLLGSGERPGRLYVLPFSTFSGDSSTGLSVTAEGFSATDGLRVMTGEDRLRCAVYGSIEGAPCTDIGVPLDLDQGAVLSFNKGVHASTSLIVTGPSRLYLVRPKVAGSPAAPGAYEALTGMWIDPETGLEFGAISAAIMPAVEKKLADILEPNRSSCAHPKVSCAGVDFDERLPLEDELSSDTNGIESSWMHYLSLAKDAATQADALGTDYINTGLQQSQNNLSTELQKEQQLERADDEIQNLQNICGTAVDPRKLLDLLAPNGDTTNASGGTCNTDADCTPASAGLHCFENQCIVDFEAILSQHTDDPDLKRLADCVSDSGLVDLISLGDKPVCVWRDSQNHNLVCQDANPGDCPRIAFAATVNAQGKYDAPCGALDPAMPAPTHTEQVFSQPLGYFQTSNSGDGAVGACDAYRKLRKDPSRWAELSANFLGNNTFNPANLTRSIERLGFEFRYGGFSAISVDDVPKYETGDPFASGPSVIGWPCQVSSKCQDEQGLFCEPTNCGDDIARSAINYTMMRAQMAAQLLGFDGQAVDPASTTTAQGATLRTPPALHGCPFDQTDFHTPSDFGSPSSDPLNFYHDNSPISRASHGALSLFDASNASILGQVAWFDGTGTPSILAQSGETDCKMAFKPGATVQQLVNVPGLDSTSFFAGMSSFAAGQTGWLKAVLTGQNHAHLSVPYSLYQPSGANAPYGSNLVEPIPWAHNLTDDDFLNAVELACEVGQPGEVNLADPPVVKTVDDLHSVSLYIGLLAQDLRNQAGSRVFFNVPTVAVNALEHASGDGSYPQFSGTLGAQLSTLEGGLVKLRETVPLLSSSIAQLAQALDTLHDLLEKSSIKKQISDLQLSSTIAQQLSNCAGSVGIQSIDSLASEATCANAIAQIDIAGQISQLEGQDANLDAQLAKASFQGTFSSVATSMQTLALHFQEGSEDVDSSLSQIEGLRDQAKVSLARALYLASHQAESAGEVSNVIGNLFDGKQIRYARALQNAKLMAFLAKRGIEERLGVRLTDLTDPLPLVDAPHNWESTVCNMTGINYQGLTSTASSDPSTPSTAATSYADGFIGDYVTKLSNVVESYRLVNSFHEGSDTAVISLRDDIMDVRATCDQLGPNELYYSNNLAFFGTPGWQVDGCQTQTVDGVDSLLPGCVTVAGNGTGLRGPGLSSAETADTQGFKLDFGSGALTTASLSQTVSLEAGAYRFSWYTPDPGTTSPGVVAGFVSAPAAPGEISIKATGLDPAVADTLDTLPWNRSYIVFQLASSQSVQIGFKRPAATTATISVGGPMLETLPQATDDFALKPFVGTGAVLTRSVPECQDTDGSVFRATKWHRDCQLLCPDGYSGNCSSANAQSYCYNETSFSFNQRDIQAGKVANFSGFARGNFNYRIQSVGLNFVGTGTRDCSSSTTPQTCGSAGYFPYSLEHVGPFFVRNFAGQDYAAHLFDGSIEHARGLATERYLTNPISSTDESLIDQYLRTEFQGRPLDGNFVLRVWDEPGVNFDALQDVQLVFKYGYWTRLN